MRKKFNINDVTNSELCIIYKIYIFKINVEMISHSRSFLQTEKTSTDYLAVLSFSHFTKINIKNQIRNSAV